MRDGDAKRRLASPGQLCIPVVAEVTQAEVVIAPFGDAFGSLGPTATRRMGRPAHHDRIVLDRHVACGLTVQAYLRHEWFGNHHALRVTDLAEAHAYRACQDAPPTRTPSS